MLSKPLLGTFACFVILYLVFRDYNKESEFTREFQIGRWNYGDNLNVSSYMLKTRAKLQPSIPLQNDVLIFVNSKVTNNVQRQDIRETWGAASRSLNISVIFHVSSNGSLLDNILQQEHALNGDILQNNLVDSYQNLTCKSRLCL